VLLLLSLEVIGKVKNMHKSAEKTKPEHLLSVTSVFLEEIKYVQVQR